MLISEETKEKLAGIIRSEGLLNLHTATKKIVTTSKFITHLQVLALGA